MATAELGKTVNFSVSAGDTIFIDAGGVGYVDVDGVRYNFNGEQYDIAVNETGQASFTLVSGACNYFVNNVVNESLSRNQAKFSKGVAGVDGNGNTYDADGDLIGKAVAVPVSRILTANDNGKTLDCTASGVDLTLPAGLDNFGCAIIINGTTRVISSGGVLLNGATTTLTITADVGAIVSTSTADSYKVVGV